MQICYYPPSIPTYHPWLEPCKKRLSNFLPNAIIQKVISQLNNRLNLNGTRCVIIDLLTTHGERRESLIMLIKPCQNVFPKKLGCETANVLLMWNPRVGLIVYVSNCKMYLIQIAKYICLRLQNIFVSKIAKRTVDDVGSAVEPEGGAHCPWIGLSQSY